MKTIWASAPKYAIVCIAAFLLLDALGFVFQDRLFRLVEQFSLPSLELLTDSEKIYTLWIGALSVHAAVGAVAPILGYTLLTTNISSASRIAPGGAVIAFEIRWSKYLRNSLALLAGSLAALLFAPSALGLGGAACATIYVIVRTLSVFKAGFDLVERPERFDASARKYLVDAVVGVLPTSPDEATEAALEALNKSLASLVPQAPYGYVAPATLRLGDPYRATQFLRTAPRSVETLNSEAEKLGYRLLRIRTALLIRVPRGRREYFALEPLPRAVSAVDEPPEQVGNKCVESGALEKLQRVLEESISYGPGSWVDDLSRMPMLVQRHVATVIYEAIPNQQPHDLVYGLDVLGQLVDAISDAHTNVFSLDEYDWVYDIPLFVSNQIECSEHSKATFARELSDFLRSRLVRWMEKPEFDLMSEAYIRLLAKLLRMFALSDPDGAEYIALVIREIPAFVQSRRMESLLMVQRALILALVDKRLSSAEHSKERRLVVRTIAEALRYSPGFERNTAVRAETMVSALAVSMFLAEGNADYTTHVTEVIAGVLDDRYSDLPFADLMSLLSTINEVNERWKWSWWELDQKERGQAHFMSMELWLTRAAAVALAPEAWRLRHFEDIEVPSEQTLGSLIRVVTEGEWTDLLPEDKRRAVEAMSEPLEELLRRRQALVRARVALAPISQEKLEKYISDQAEEIVQTFGRHNEWLRRAGVVDIEDREDESHQAGVVRLLPREWFVADEVLDVPIHVGGMHVGSALVDFEVRKISKTLRDLPGVETEVLSPSDGRIWKCVKEMVDRGASHLLIIGINASEYDAYAEYGAARAYAQSVGSDIRFESVRGAEDRWSGLVVADVANAFRLVRRRPSAQGTLLAGVSRSLEDGGVVTQVVGITDQMRSEWLRGKAEEEAVAEDTRYRESVLSRTVLSVEVVIRPSPAIAVFGISQP